ncbi:MAG: hypothetical protein AB1938_20185 [Myxococcota bacterium]
MSYDILSTLPPGSTSRTRLAMRDGRRKVVLRVVREGVEPFLPEKTPEAVLPLIEISEQQGVRYAVYDYLRGVTLRELVEALREGDQPVPLALAARIVVDAARAVGQLHGTHPPVPAHGGLSDAAILIGFDGAVRVLDYGVPRPSRFQPSVPGGAHGDVFALGAVLHSVLTDFAGSWADAVDDGVPLPQPSAMHPEATPALDDVLARATSRAFAKRQVDAGMLADELEAVQGDALASRGELAEVLRRFFAARLEDATGPSAAPARAVKLEPNEAALGYDNDAPTGAHVAPWLKGEQPPGADAGGTRRAVVPWVTGTTGEDFPAAAPPPGMERGRPGPELGGGIPSGTEPGRPGPALLGRIPSGTEPGRAGPFAGGAAPPEVGEGEPDGTQPRIPLPAPPAPPAGPRPEPAATRPRTTSGARAATARPAPNPPSSGDTAENEVPTESTNPGKALPASLRDAGEDAAPPPLVEAEPTRPRASAPPPRASRGEEAAPALGEGEPEATRPRARVPVAQDTNPNLGGPADTGPTPIEHLDTNPRARGRGDTGPSPVENLDTNPRASAPRSRNTTVHERLQARGQERIPTPPVGVPAAPSEEELDDDVVNVPTHVRAKPKPPAVDSEGELPMTAEAAQPNSARRWIAALLLLLAVGFGAVALFAPQKLAALKVRLGLAPPPEPEPQELPEEDVFDAGPAAQVDDAGPPAAAAATDVDAGEEEEEEEDGDGGEEEDDEEPDAGADAGVSDAGLPGDAGPTLDAGSGPKPAVKAPPRKKKKKKKRRR